MLIAHISDTHIADPDEKTFGFVPMAENLARCVAHINALNPSPDVVLLSGDVTNNGTIVQTERAKVILDDLACPYYIVPGNHDTRAALQTVFGDTACPSQADGFISFVIDGHALRLIGLDSTIPKASGGMICEVRANWLSDRLAEKPDTPTVIFLHHPPLKCGVPETDVDGFIGATMLGEIVKPHPNIERILCGHIHLLTHARWNGTLVTTAPSMGMELALDLTQKAESRFIVSEPSYLLHHWSADKVLVTHTISVGEPVTSYDFTPHEL